MKPSTRRFHRRTMKEPRKLAHRAVFASICFLLFGALAQAQEPAKTVDSRGTRPDQAPAEHSVQRIVEQGIAIEFTINPLKQKSKLTAGQDAVVKFTVNDTTTGTPVKGLGLSVWLSLRAGDRAPEARECREKIQSYMTGSLRTRPEVDLNSYYVLTLNESSDISVIDPLLGYGGSKLLTLVMLKSPGEDWVLTEDGATLFVSLPRVNQIAVIDTRNWVVKSYIDTGVKPMRIALQSDQKYLWVANDGQGDEAGGITVIDTSTLNVAAQITVGVGHHEMIISRDNRFVFVSNQESGTLSVIDVRKLEKIKDIAVGTAPVSMARSELSKGIYLVSETEGTITVVDEQSQEVLMRMKGRPGLRAIRFAPGGRYGFALNSSESTVHILDAATNRVLHDARIGRIPDQIIFSDTFAFVRSLGTESVAMIRLASINKNVEVTEFPGGQEPPEKASPPLSADAIVLAPEGNSVIVANPADRILYYYTEGMAAPMGHFQNYRREPRAVMVVDRSLRESTPGTYSASVKLPASGKYDVAFLADSPRIAHCFEATAQPNPALKEMLPVALRIEYQLKRVELPVGENFRLRFKLTETATNRVKDGLKDVRVLTSQASGAWQRRDVAKSVGKGIYEISINVPEGGVYLVFVESASMRVSYRDLPPLTLHANDRKTSE